MSRDRSQAETAQAPPDAGPDPGPDPVPLKPARGTPVPPGQRGRTLGRARAPEPGPTLVLVAAVHGNEPAGVIAAERVLKAIERGERRLNRGGVVAVIGNLTAYNHPDLTARYLHHDLNRSFTTEQLRAARKAPEGSRTVEQHESLELLGLLRREVGAARGPVHLLDMHTTSSTSRPFVVLGDAIPCRRMGRRLGLPVVLGLEEELDGVLADYASESLGIVSVLVEGGQHLAPESVSVLEQAIWVTLDGLGMVSLENGQRKHARRVLRAAAGIQAGRVYDIRHREPVTDPGLTIPEELLSFGRARAGRTVLAVQHGRARVSPETGTVLMPNRQARKRVGDDAVFVAQRIGTLWLWVSALLRRGGVVHRWLPRVAPGVRPRSGPPSNHGAKHGTKNGAGEVPGDERRDELLIAPEIAAVFRRELLHLLGYRIVRHTPDPHWHGLKRLTKGTGAVLEAVVSMMTGTFTGGEPAALHEERDEDWIVRRRRLDAGPPAGADGDRSQSPKQV